MINVLLSRLCCDGRKRAVGVPRDSMSSLGWVISHLQFFRNLGNDMRLNSRNRLDLMLPNICPYPLLMSPVSVPSSPTSSPSSHPSISPTSTPSSLPFSVSYIQPFTLSYIQNTTVYQ